ncbi:fluoride efflux transporter FluC [Modestobacter marinus]|uniref:fluoride efflux transporter FluC n=1 Tax=Modestobacter marinus TaxID=477641 RepID=UPI001C98CCB1|nr:CrcB family protein [Modestobacter marinus]
MTTHDQPTRGRQRSWDVLAAVAAGGVLGAEARYGLSLVLPQSTGQWPWATWLVNVSGCFLIGVLMVVVTELTSPHRLLRPFLVVGVLGGYTTFATAMVDVQQLALAGRAGAALGYLLGTLAAAVLATYAGATLARALGRRGRVADPEPR